MTVGPDHVQVYGNDHSPWVQAVLLGLHEKRVAHTLTLAPPLSVFRNSGVLMPAAKIDDGEWTLDSERILVSLGFSPVEEEVHADLMALFRSSAMRRADSPWEFWRRFSWVRDGHPAAPRRLWNQFWRTFSIFYFFTMITLARSRVPKAPREQLVEEYQALQRRLAPDDRFFAGDAPSTFDLQLFGIVQMLASIPGTALTVLREEPSLDRLREWIEAMQQRFERYEHLYTARTFAPNVAEKTVAPLHERLCFWLGGATMFAALPITLPLVFFLVGSIRRRGLQDPLTTRAADRG
jgi:glutathione S-transferase